MTTGLRPVHRLPAALLAPLLLAMVATSCAVNPADVEATAETAVERYVAAVAAGDLDAATAMTDPRALMPPQRAGESLVDATGALSSAAALPDHPWVRFLDRRAIHLPERGTRPAETVAAIRFRVSYLVGTATGHDVVAVMADGDGWRIVDGLLLDVEIHTGTDRLRAFTFGRMRVTVNEPSTTVWGYPGAYVAAGADVAEGYVVDPVTVHLGAEVVSAWDDTELRLQVERAGSPPR